MSAITLPGRRSTRPKHRASDEVRELRNWKTAANTYFQTLRQDLADMYEAWQNADTKVANANDFIALQNASLRCANERVAELEAELAAQTRELNQLRAFRDNTLAVSVLAVGQRDIDPDDQPTAPAGINVTTLWAAMGHVPARDNPQATNPAHVPAWAKTEAGVA